MNILLKKQAFRALFKSFTNLLPCYNYNKADFTEIVNNAIFIGKTCGFHFLVTKSPDFK